MRLTPSTLSAAALVPLVGASIISLSQPSAAVSTEPASTTAPSSPQTAPASTTEDCLSCHADLEPGFRADRHARLDTDGLASEAGAESSCVACHGDSPEHVDTDGEAPIFAFGPDDPTIERSERCLTCHANEHPSFQASPHGRAGIDCASCHPSHSGPEAVLTGDLSPRVGPSPLVGRDSESCVGCHAGVMTEFTFTEHHRLEEGVMSCTSCHDPHAPDQRMMLGGFKQQECIGCHQDKGGPYVFEHGSLTVEGCTACHSPHGSPSRHMLKFQPVAELCYGCHIIVPGFHVRFESSTVCTNCHTTIHGSNLHPAFLQ